MSKLKVTVTGMRNAAEQLKSEKQELAGLVQQVGDVRRNLPFKVRARANIEGDLQSLDHSLSQNVLNLDSMIQCLENAIVAYQNCENKVAENELGNLPEGVMDMVKRIIAAGLVAAAQAEKTFEQNLMTQYGFDERTAKILWGVYQKIQEKYKDLPQKERDWYFARALSQMGDYNNKEVSWLIFFDRNPCMEKWSWWSICI